MRRLLCALCALALLCAPCLARAAEGELVIFTSHKADVYLPLIREFELRTGIYVRVETGGTTELLERIAASDAPPCDCMFGGGVESLLAYERFFAPIRVPQGADILPQCETGSDRIIPFSTLPMVIIYNPKLMRDPPRDWLDLLDARYLGRIAFAAPDVSGSSYTALATLCRALPDVPDALERFARNLGGRVLAGSGLVTGAVASGECTVGVTLEETALRAIRAGQDIQIAYPRSGTSAVPDGAAVLQSCAHPRAAELFIDFILSADVQSRLPSRFDRRAVRALDGGAAPSGDITLLDYDIPLATAQKAALLSRFAACMAEVSR